VGEENFLAWYKPTPEEYLMKKMNVGTVLVAFGALLMMSGGAVAQNATDQGMHKDSSFAAAAASGGTAEVKLGQLAEEKGSNDSVKNFGKRMENHSAANDKLQALVQKDGINVPSTLSAEDQREYDRLSGLSGAQFDRAYAQAMVQDHQKDIAAFKQEASNGQNPDLKNFASQTLPTLQEHLRMAQQMQQSVRSGQ
jgi:putative membrane protein